MKTITALLFFVLTLALNPAWGVPIEVTVHRTIGGAFTIKTSQVQGTIVSEKETVKAASVKVDATSLKVDDQELLTKHIQERLETDHFPTIELTGAEGTNGTGKGIITIKGIAKPVTGQFKVQGNKIVAEFKLSMADFKIEKVRYLGVGAKDEVEIKVELPIKN